MAERHAVADLLTPEMKARVQAATFTSRRSASKRAQVTAKIGRFLCCPLGVALGRYDRDFYRFPGVGIALNLLGVPDDETAWDAVDDFTEMVDTGKVAPEDVKVMLGVSDLEEERHEPA